MVRIRSGRVGALTAALGMMVSGSAANAESLHKNLQWIVRYREPQNSLAQAALKTRSLLPPFLRNSADQARIVNGAEGVVQLSFSSEAEAESALNHLRDSGDVVSVAPDHWYKPALHLVSRPSEEFAEEAVPFLGAPLAGVAVSAVSGEEGLLSAFSQAFQRAGLPDVKPAPASEIPGTDPLAARDWALKSIRMPAVDGAPEKSNIVAAVIDTGVNYNHEDLSGAMWRSPSNPSEVGYDFAHHNAKPFDVVKFDIAGCMKDSACSSGTDTEKFLVNPGHGTHCAGHVGAVANNSLGIMGVGAPMGVKVMALKFFFDAGDPNAGAGDDAAAIQSIDYAIQNGAKVISASWGGRMTKEEAGKSELKAALERARKAGVLLVVAAGNDSINQDTDEQPSYPAAYSDEFDNILVVAAIDANDQLADFSNYGEKSVHIGAPGVKIFSTTADGKYNDVVARYIGSNGKPHEMDWDGTSMATPIVAGAASLIWAKNPSLTYLDVKRRLMGSARKLPSLAGKTATGGTLDVRAALSAR